MEKLGEYRIRRLIGGGGMGNVYEAEEAMSGRRVALKVLHPSLAKSAGRERFFMEMRILGELQHPNIVRSLRCAELDGELVLVLEYLEGRTLREELDALGRLPVERAISMVSAVASALVVAHERTPPIVHRDLKPENLMVLPDGNMKVMDFGIAKVLEEGQTRTKTTQIVGTAQYMSPEQIDNRNVTPRCDLYALGIVFYEMLAGKPPFVEDSLLALLRAQCEALPPTLPEDVRARLPQHVEELLFRMLEKQPAERPSGAREVVDTLAPGVVSRPASSGSTRRSSGGAAAATHPSGRSLQSKASGADTIAIVDRLDARRWKWVAASAGLLLTIGVAVALTILQPWKATATPKKPKATAQSITSEQPAAPPTATARKGGDRFLQWDVPAAWTEFRADDLFVVAAYKVPRAAGDTEDAEVRMRAPSKSGTATANFRNDFDLCPGCFNEVAVQIDGVNANVFDVRGDFWADPRHAKGAAPKPKFAAAGCYMPVGKTFYSIILLGPERSVAAARPDLDKLVGSLRRLNP